MSAGVKESAFPYRRILVTGVTGQVGRGFRRILERDFTAGKEAFFLDRNEFDLSRPDSLTEVLDRLRPDLVIHPAAYTKVDLAETERELAWTVNAVAPGVIARWCAKGNIPFVSFSTDYVFDGSGQVARVESDPVAPLNVYGQSKLAGEHRIQEEGGRFLIFRTSWVYDVDGSNFVNTMLRLGESKPLLKVVADQIGGPTYVPHLCEAVLEVLCHPIQPGIYHLTGQGETGWFGFAQKIFANALEFGFLQTAPEVLPVPSSEYAVPAKRPLNSRLSGQKLADVYGVRMPDWEDGLRNFFIRKRSL